MVIKFSHLSLKTLQFLNVYFIYIDMNKKIANVLIIDDHIAIIEGFERAIGYIAERSETLSFKIDFAKDCKTAYHKIQQYAVTQNLDLVILDLGLPAAPKLNLQSGDDIGVLLRKLTPNTKILVCTCFTNSFRLIQAIDNYNPMGLLNKQDVGLSGFVSAIEDVLAGNVHYSKTIINALKQKSLNNIKLDAYDLLILKELANGANMRDLLKLVHLSQSTIDKRKRLLKRKFNIDSNSDRDLVLVAREKGLI